MPVYFFTATFKLVNELCNLYSIVFELPQICFDDESSLINHSIYFHFNCKILFYALINTFINTFYLLNMNYKQNFEHHNCAVSLNKLINMNI